MAALPVSRRGVAVRGVGWGCPGLGEGLQLCQPRQSARHLGANRARAPSPLLACFLDHSLPSSLPFSRGRGSETAAKRSGPALEECGFAEGAEPEAVSPRFEPRRSSPTSGGPAPEQLEVIEPGKQGGQGRAHGDQIGRHTGSQTDKHPPTGPQRGRERTEDTVRDKDTANKGMPPELEGDEHESGGVGTEAGTCGDQTGNARRTRS